MLSMEGGRRENEGRRKKVKRGRKCKRKNGRRKEERKERPKTRIITKINRSIFNR